MITAQEYIGEASADTSMCSLGNSSWTATHGTYRHSFVVVKYERQTCGPAAASCWFARPLNDCGTEFRIYATTDESVLGRCCCVMNAFGWPFPSLAVSLDVPATWTITIADSRLTAEGLWRIVDFVLVTEHSLHNMLARASLLDRADKSIVDSSVGRSVRRDSLRTANVTLHYGVRAIVATWAMQDALPPNMLALFARAPLPVRAITGGAWPAITFAGGNVAVAAIDGRSAERITRVGDEMEYLSDEDAGEEAYAEATMLSEACRAAGFCNSSRIQILICQTHHVAPDERRCQAVCQEACGAVPLRIMVTGVPMSHVATLAHSIYSKLAEDPTDLGFGECPDIFTVVPSPETIHMNENERANRVEATRLIRREVERRLGGIKAHLWRPSGNLVQAAREAIWPGVS